MYHHNPIYTATQPPVLSPDTNSFGPPTQNTLTPTSGHPFSHHGHLGQGLFQGVSDASFSQGGTPGRSPRSPLSGPFYFPGMGSDAGGLVSPIMSTSSAMSSDQTDIPAPLLVPPVSPGLCAICHDRATGKHYGASSCDGCKGFFRRTIRKDQVYSCRFDQKCVIDKDKRNSCRFCRFRKCVRAGMKRDAVQNERDRIQKRSGHAHLSTDAKRSRDGSISPTPSPASAPQTPQPSPIPTASSKPMRASFREYITILLKAEALYTASQERATVITRTADQMPSPTSTNFNGFDDEDSRDRNSSGGKNGPRWSEDLPRIATVNDVSESMHQQLLLMVEWAKTLEPFSVLSIEDQIVLLRSYAAQHLLICVAHRSRHVKDYLLLTNSTCLPREVSPEIPDVNHVTVRVLDELVGPMNQLQMDDTEFVCLRALVFFNPRAKGLEERLGRVEKTRNGILSALQEYVSDKPSPVTRFGNLLLLLPPLQAISQNLIEDVHLASMFGMARIDSLLQELLLAGIDETGDSRSVLASMSNGASRAEAIEDDLLFGPFRNGSGVSAANQRRDEISQPIRSRLAAEDSPAMDTRSMDDDEAAFMEFQSSIELKREMD